MSTTSSSELILNSDGSVYHLHLLPEQVADTVITVGDPDRVTMVSKHFDRIEHRVQKREFITHTGYIGHKRITVISTGIGPDNIDIVFNELNILRNYNFNTQSFNAVANPLQIIRFGTSGAIQADIPVNSLLASSFGIGIDNVLHFYQFENTKEEAAICEQFKLHCYFNHTIHPYVFSADTHLLAQLDNTFIKGITLTAPGFYAPQGRAVGYSLTHPEFYNDLRSFRHLDWRITNIEMETATMFGLSRVLQHQCLSLNVLLANRATGTFSADPRAAVENLIRHGLTFIAGL